LDLKEKKEWVKVPFSGSLSQAYCRSCIAIDHSSILIFGGNSGKYLDEVLQFQVKQGSEHTLAKSGTLPIQTFFRYTAPPILQEGKIFVFDYQSNLLVFDQKSWKLKGKNEWSTL
jgi:hypothetical protein